MIAKRREDDLVIQVTSTPTGHDIDVVLGGRALASAVAANASANHHGGQRTLLGRYDQASNTLTTHPVTLTAGSPYFLLPKYDRVATITFEGYGSLDDGFGNLDYEALKLPSGFVKDMFGGFGATYELRFIIEEIERAGHFTHLALSEHPATGGGTTAHLTYGAFDTWRRAIRRSHDRAVQFGNRAKRDYLRSAVAGELGIVPAATPPGLDPAALADSVLIALNLQGRQAPVSAATDVVRGVRRNHKALKAAGSELLELNREIELLTLEDLIARLEAHITKRHNEAFWQAFLSDNPFIIRLAFGLPIAVFGEQVAVGGIKFDGSGGKIADYLLRAGAYGNMAIVEIKTPDTDLVRKKHYRGGVHAPDKEVAGAVTQVLDQRYQLQMEINNKKVASGQFDVFTYSIQALIIAGRDMDDADHRKSFELFRNGLKDVTIVTFTELLMKLKALHAFLTFDPAAGPSVAGSLAPSAGDLTAAQTPTPTPAP
ncbi:Shedu immune nuclease family protein [Sphingomonas sp. 2SG]|uniref:Shedu immune nuclease family protein n=1 Tax=Sphingomonas sp. 2SG TaxID=2502201 RepID=UPI001484D36B|nr:Shedu immune nuclease family protein [Sphingomonas sp. 2SG]